MIIFNYVGLIISVIAFAMAFGIGKLFGAEMNGVHMIIAGPLVAAMDIIYRLKTEDGHLYIPHRGGSLFFLPAWTLGVFWFFLGIFYVVFGRG